MLILKRTISLKQTEERIERRASFVMLFCTNKSLLLYQPSETEIPFTLYCESKDEKKGLKMGEKTRLICLLQTWYVCDTGKVARRGTAISEQPT